MNKNSDKDIDMSNPKVLFSHILSLSNQNKFKEALTLIEVNFDLLFNFDAAALIKMHIAILNDYQKLSFIDKAIKLYSDKPYINIESEQLLKQLEANKHIDIRKPHYAYVQWLSDISSNQEAKINKAINLTTLSFLKKGIATYQILLNSPTLPMIRYLALIKLVNLKFAQEVIFENDGLTYNLLPSLLEPFNQTPFYQAFIKYIQSKKILNHQTEMIISLFNDYLMAIYPDEPLIEEKPLLFNALFCLMNKYLNLAQQEASAPVMTIANEIEERLMSFQSSK